MDCSAHRIRRGRATAIQATFERDCEQPIIGGETDFGADHAVVFVFVTALHELGAQAFPEGLPSYPAWWRRRRPRGAKGAA